MEERMSYVENNLMNGEEIVYRGVMHWISYGWPVFWIAIGLLSLIGGAGAPGFYLLLIGVIFGALAFLNVKNSEFVITNKRVIMKTGIVRRHSLETLLTKIEGIGVGEGIFGRIFGYGTIIVNGTGGSKEGFIRVSNPLEFRKELQQILDTKQ
jgi:uncharacterized membrane protein YdbT with pleckstrin-like domain